jgi:hypothetical protein
MIAGAIRIHMWYKFEISWVIHAGCKKGGHMES